MPADKPMLTKLAAALQKKAGNPIASAAKAVSKPVAEAVSEVAGNPKATTSILEQLRQLLSNRGVRAGAGALTGGGASLAHSMGAGDSAETAFLKALGAAGAGAGLGAFVQPRHIIPMGAGAGLLGAGLALGRGGGRDTLYSQYVRQDIPPGGAYPQLTPEYIRGIKNTQRLARGTLPGFNEHGMLLPRKLRYNPYG